MISDINTIEVMDLNTSRTDAMARRKASKVRFCRNTEKFKLSRFFKLHLYICFRFRFLFLSCRNAALMLWLGAGMKNSWLRLGLQDFL